MFIGRLLALRGVLGALVVLGALNLLIFPVFSEELGGDLNPSEMGIERVMRNIRRGESDMMTCASGYFLTKKGDHGKAREVFEGCAEAGISGAMTWLGHLAGNGLGGKYDPVLEAEWDRRAAESGDSVGLFNYGLDLLRGHGVERDEVLGRRYVDEAALAGLDAARRLRGSGYDVEEVTPDSDSMVWEFSDGG